MTVRHVTPHCNLYLLYYHLKTVKTFLNLFSIFFRFRTTLIIKTRITLSGLQCPTGKIGYRRRGSSRARRGSNLADRVGFRVEA